MWNRAFRVNFSPSERNYVRNRAGHNKNRTMIPSPVVSFMTVSNLWSPVVSLKTRPASNSVAICLPHSGFLLTSILQMSAVQLHSESSIEFSLLEAHRRVVSFFYLQIPKNCRRRSDHKQNRSIQKRADDIQSHIIDFPKNLSPTPLGTHHSSAG